MIVLPSLRQKTPQGLFKLFDCSEEYGREISFPFVSKMEMRFFSGSATCILSFPSTEREKIYSLANHEIDCNNLNIEQVGKKIINLYEKI